MLGDSGFTLVVVFYPVILVVLGSFQSARPDQPNTYGLDAWRTAFTTPDLLTSIWNTIDLTVARQLISLTIAIPLAWALARTDIPGSKALEFMFWVAFFMPTLPVLLGWIILLAPDYGLLNRLIKLLPFVRNGPFDIYSFWGIVWVHLVTSAVSFKVMLLTPAFRNMDASLEEASHASGAGPVHTLVHVVIPAMAPIVSVVLLLTTIYCFHSFEIELVLGVPIRFFVFSSLTYQLIGQEPPLFPNAGRLEHHGSSLADTVRGAATVDRRETELRSRRRKVQGAPRSSAPVAMARVCSRLVDGSAHHGRSGRLSDHGNIHEAVRLL